jgi:hypothetical protein
MGMTAGGMAVFAEEGGLLFGGSCWAVRDAFVQASLFCADVLCKEQAAPRSGGAMRCCVTKGVNGLTSKWDFGILQVAVA